MIDGSSFSGNNLSTGVIVCFCVVYLAYAPPAHSQGLPFGQFVAVDLLYDADESAEIVSYAALPAGAYGNVIFLDLDHDNDLDLYVSGYSDRPFAYVAEGLYDALVPVGNNTFEWRRYFSPPQALPDVWKGSASVTDLNFDGGVDIIANGAAFENAPSDARLTVSLSGGRKVFDTGFVNSIQATADYDSDGRADLLISGIADDGSYGSRLLTWAGGNWQPKSGALPALAYGSAAWCDFDGDDDFDLFLGGMKYDGTKVADIYENADGTLISRHLHLPGLIYGNAACGDYDADGDPDLLLTGGIIDPLEVMRGATYLYRNDGGSLTLAHTFPGIIQGEGHWGDADNDGDLDILLVGNSHYNGVGSTTIFLNEEGAFTPSEFISLVPARKPTSIDWGDYDDDGDLDFIVLGRFGVLRIRIYKNEVLHVNNPPAAPAGLQATVTGDRVTFTWSEASDDHTPSQSLTYNLRVGTTPGGIDVVSPLAHPQTGQRWVSGFGNTGLGTTHFLRNLPSGAYYWSVQALDTSFKGSPFAGEGTFVIP